MKTMIGMLLIAVLVFTAWRFIQSSALQERIGVR